MGTFRRGDCPNLVKGSSYYCKIKWGEIINRTDLTPKQKFSRLKKLTCSGCEIYKEMKENER
jgi:hypothetical protein